MKAESANKFGLLCRRTNHDSGFMIRFAWKCCSPSLSSKNQGLLFNSTVFRIDASLRGGPGPWLRKVDLKTSPLPVQKGALLWSIFILMDGETWRTEEKKRRQLDQNSAGLSLICIQWSTAISSPPFITRSPSPIHTCIHNPLMLCAAEGARAGSWVINVWFVLRLLTWEQSDPLKKNKKKTMSDCRCPAEHLPGILGWIQITDNKYFIYTGHSGGSYKRKRKQPSNLLTRSSCVCSAPKCGSCVCMVCIYVNVCLYRKYSVHCSSGPGCLGLDTVYFPLLFFTAPGSSGKWKLPYGITLSTGIIWREVEMIVCCRIKESPISA